MVSKQIHRLSRIAISLNLNPDSQPISLLNYDIFQSETRGGKVGRDLVKWSVWSNLPLLCEISQAKYRYLNVNQDNKEFCQVNFGW